LAAGLLDLSCAANAAATLNWLTINRPQHWRQLCAVLLAPVNNMLHAWSGDRRGDLPIPLAELALPLLRVSQAAIQALLQRNAAQQMRFRRYQLFKHLQHLQESAAALAENGSRCSRAATEQIRQDVAAKSDAEVLAALRADRVFMPGILLSEDNRKLCCAALQCQEHVLEAGSTPTGLFRGQTQQLLSELASSDEFAAAAVQLLVPCCRSWFVLNEERLIQQQQKQEKLAKQQAAAGDGDAAATPSSSSSSRECLVPKKQMLASEVVVAPAHKANPTDTYRLAMVFLDMTKSQVCGG
jgi:hypothetical protein